MTEPWDERRLAAFLMTKHRRSDSDWTRRPSPFFASLGQSTIECSVPVARPEALPELAAHPDRGARRNPHRREPD